IPPRKSLLLLTSRGECQQLVAGCLGPAGKPPIFRPGGLRSFSVTQYAGTKFATAEALACLD
ncbi:MAG: hypothetical protein WCT12_35150, partial [Verrucomicrobiota bacterium]